MNLKKTTNGGTCEFTLSGKFTFSDHQTFRNVINVISSKTITSVILELSNLEFIDSAALGMFLVAREEAKKNNVELILQSPVGHVQKMFDLSNFRTLFEVR